MDFGLLCIPAVQDHPEVLARYQEPVPLHSGADVIRMPILHSTARVPTPETISMSVLGMMQVSLLQWCDIDKRILYFTKVYPGEGRWLGAELVPPRPLFRAAAA